MTELIFESLFDAFYNKSRIKRSLEYKTLYDFKTFPFDLGWNNFKEGL